MHKDVTSSNLAPIIFTRVLGLCTGFLKVLGGVFPLTPPTMWYMFYKNPTLNLKFKKGPMESLQFKDIRAKLNKTQKELAQLLGVSIKAIHSYEQGWRKIPHHVERQLLFLFSRTLMDHDRQPEHCWDILKCPDKKLKKCPAWEFKSGGLCWFINGTKCSGEAHNSWADKMEECRSCKVFKSFFEPKEGR
jgi:DNA-binding XRE family transcriptional regulator